MDECLIIGREEELSTFDELVAARGSGVVLIVGRPGVGKTRFMKALRTRTGSDWTVAFADEKGELSVGFSTTPQTFTARLRQLLGLSPDGEGMPLLLDDVRGLTRVGAEEHTQQPLPAYGLLAFLNSLSDEHNLSQHEIDKGSGIETSGQSSKAQSTPGRRRRTPILLDQIRQLAPVLIGIDGYEPNPAFERWFESGLRDVVESTKHVIVVVAAVPGIVERLASRIAATATIRLGSLSSGTVRTHLLSVCQTLDPPLTSDELDVYSSVTSKDPALLDSLCAVLTVENAESSDKRS